ncbi:MAG: sugar phosphate isomerase/epimerase [Candidatus Latescibacteria bacterium]|nr:sugar phosphate isomerase/epimerase [Candidatus Latescibacterota bacterium]
MPKNMTRRRAIAAATGATGGLLGTVSSKAQAYSLPKTWGEDFLTPWSPPEDVKRDLAPGSTPVRLSCVAYGLNYSKDTSIGEKVKKVRELGYTAAEAGGEWKDAPDSAVREVKAACKEHDVLFYALHRCINNIHPDPAERRRINKEVAKLVETADRLDLSFIVTHTGSCNPERPTLPHKDNWTKEAWDASVEAMKQILRDTSGSKVNLAVEAINPTNINNPRAHVRLREDVGDPRIKVTLDPQNMLNPNTYYRTTELVNECFDLFGEDIMYAHAKDVQWDQVMLPAFSWVIPGTGTMDYETYLTRLSRLKYPRAFLLEFLSREQYPQAKKFIEETAAKVGVTIYK